MSRGKKQRPKKASPRVPDRGVAERLGPATVPAAIPPLADTRRFWVIVLALLAVGFLLRLAGSRGELWLDELWSLNRACVLDHPWQVVTSLHHDNNHYLTSLWLWVVGPARDWWVYRVPSVIAGTAAVFFAARVGLRQSTVSGLAAGAATALSYLLVLYSSEARGYAIACCLGLSAFDFMELYLRDRQRRFLLGYALSASIGLLGSLTFASLAVAFGLWSGAVLLWRERNRRAALQYVALHALPGIVVAILWWVDIRHIEIGGGPMLRLWAVLRETITNALGFPLPSPAGDLMLVASLVFIGWQIVRLARSADLRWIFFLAVLLLAPASLLLRTGRVNLLYPRYFLVNVTFFYLLAALAWGALWDSHARGLRGVLLAFAAVWFSGNILLSLELCRIGRGHYREALELIAANTAGGRPRIGSNQKLRSETLIGYYGKYLPEDKRPIVVPFEALRQARPQWILTTDSPYEVEHSRSTLRAGPGLTYDLQKEFPSVRLSGFPARIYQRHD